MKQILNVAALTVTAVLMQPALAGPEKIKIGVMTDLSGSASDIGKGSVAAAQIAVADFGGTVLGRPIEVIVADTLNKADTASSTARSWIDVDKVDALFDFGLTHTALAVLPIAAEKNKIAIAVAPAGTNITNEGCTATSFHWMYDTHALAVGTAKVLLDQGKKNWYFITVDYAFGLALEKDASEYIKANGGSVVGSVKHPYNVGDMSSYVVRAQSSKADVIALANATTDTVNSIKQAREFGIMPKQYVAPLVTYLESVHGMGLNVAKNLYTLEGFYWDQNERSRRFADKYRAKMGGSAPGSLPAGTYSAVISYLKAVEAAGTDDTAAVVKQLKTMTIDDDVVQNGHVRADGRMVHEMTVYQIKTPEESKKPWDYYKKVATVPGDIAFQPLEKSRCPLVK